MHSKYHAPPADPVYSIPPSSSSSSSHRPQPHYASSSFPAGQPLVNGFDDPSRTSTDFSRPPAGTSPPTSSPSYSSCQLRHQVADLEHKQSVLIHKLKSERKEREQERLEHAEVVRALEEEVERLKRRAGVLDQQRARRESVEQEREWKTRLDELEQENELRGKQEAVEVAEERARAAGGATMTVRNELRLCKAEGEKKDDEITRLKIRLADLVLSPGAPASPPAPASPSKPHSPTSAHIPSSQPPSAPGSASSSPSHPVRLAFSSSPPAQLPQYPIARAAALLLPLALLSLPAHLRPRLRPHPRSSFADKRRSVVPLVAACRGRALQDVWKER